MFSQFACHQLPNYTENANFQIRISQNVKNRLYAPLLVNPRYRPVLLFLISKRYWGETILSPQYPGEYWGESPCCPCGVGAYGAVAIYEANEATASVKFVASVKI